jgi:hypothetical protein
VASTNTLAWTFSPVSIVAETIREPSFSTDIKQRRKSTSTPTAFEHGEIKFFRSGWRKIPDTTDLGYKTSSPNHQ